MDTGSKFQLMARGGYGARGAVFLLIAGLALFSGIAGGKPETKSALDSVLKQPFGRIWLLLIAIGLIGFVGWRLAQSLGNADGLASNAKGYLTRAALFGSAVTYSGFAIYAVQQATDIGAESGSGGEKGLAAWAMSQPFGQYLAGAIGIGFVIGGIVTITKGLMRKFERNLRLDSSTRKPIVLLCIYGLVARGLIFVVVGVFFVYAAFTVNPDQAGSMADALTWIRQLPFGGILYVIAALGLASFGIYNFVQARYRIVRQVGIPTPSLGTFG
ncbi:DUF1206 domain-containing protein [Pararhizobium gei]|uniref:DUF1206 domain-containing protein n=1 Tax=Pararhizobium gei TaxID=1395951 RepID=UPI0023D9E2FD|nr:DUF1206 domain-containing protein [Rhizobium gei]